MKNAAMRRKLGRMLAGLILSLLLVCAFTPLARADSESPASPPDKNVTNVVVVLRFEQDKPAWSPTSGTTMEITGGKLLYKVTGSLKSMRSSGPRIDKIDKDYYTVSADVRLASGNPFGGFGIGVTNMEGAGYSFLINGNGKYQFIQFIPITSDKPGVGRLKMSEIKPWTSHPAIHEDAVNTIGLSPSGDKCELRVNGQVVSQLDFDPIKPGIITITVGKGQTVEFDNIMATIP